MLTCMIGSPEKSRLFTPLLLIFCFLCRDQSANTPFISSGHYDDKCDVNYDLYITEGPVELVPGEICVAEY